MGLSIAKLTAEERSFTWKVMGEDVPVTYRPGVLTQDWIANADDSKAQGTALSEAVISIEILNGTGKPIEPTAANFRKYLPFALGTKLAIAMIRDATVDPTTAETSGDS